MQIGALAQATGRSRDSLHFYEKRGLSQLRAELARRLGPQMQQCPLRGADHAAG